MYTYLEIDIGETIMRALFFVVILLLYIYIIYLSFHSFSIFDSMSSNFIPLVSNTNSFTKTKPSRFNIA